MKIYIKESVSYDILKKDERYIWLHFPVFGHLDFHTLKPDVFRGIVSDIREWVKASDDETIEQAIYNQDDTRSPYDTLKEWLQDSTDSNGQVDYSIVENNRNLADSISYLLYGEPVYVGM